MTQEDKELLLKDLCGRLLYGVRVKTPYNDATIIGITSRKGYKKEEYYIDVITDKQTYPIRYIKPYLRPMSSMTEEEKKELEDEIDKDFKLAIIACKENDITKSTSGFYKIDWLNAHHFDYRGLIPMGLAIAVTEENNPYKE